VTLGHKDSPLLILLWMPLMASILLKLYPNNIFNLMFLTHLSITLIAIIFEFTYVKTNKFEKITTLTTFLSVTSFMVILIYSIYCFFTL